MYPHFSIWLTVGRRVKEQNRSWKVVCNMNAPVCLNSPPLHTSTFESVTLESHRNWKKFFRVTIHFSDIIEDSAS